MNKYSFISEEIKNRVNFKQAAEFYGIAFNNSGFACCPFHTEKTASFSVKNNNFAHCFGCGWSGDVISFTKQLFDLDFVAALAKLNCDFALSLPIKRKATLREQHEIIRKRQEIEAEQTRIEARKKLYWELWEARINYDTAIRNLAPASPNEPIDPRYAEALKNIDYIDFRIDTEL